MLGQVGEEGTAERMTLETCRLVASWIGSRAFGVDDEHGETAELRLELHAFWALKSSKMAALIWQAIATASTSKLSVLHFQVDAVCKV